MGWQDAPVVGQSDAQPKWMSAPVIGEPEPEGGAGRIAALGARAVGEGAASTLLAPADLMTAASRMAPPAIPTLQVLKGLQDATGKTPSQLVALALNKTFGLNLSESESFQGLLSDTLTQAGAPAPET